MDLTQSATIVGILGFVIGIGVPLAMLVVAGTVVLRANKRAATLIAASAVLSLLIRVLVVVSQMAAARLGADSLAQQTIYAQGGAALASTIAAGLLIAGIVALANGKSNERP